MKRSAILLAILVAACAQPAAPPPLERALGTANAKSEPEPAAEGAKAPHSLAGEWRVAGIDGAPLDEPYGLALSADGRRIWWEPLCAGVVRGYRIVGDRITVGPDPDEPPRRAGDATRAVCAIGLPPRLADVMRAIDSAETIRRTPANGIELAGGGHSLLLFSQ